MTRMTPQAILFDLDGTLVDSYRGIVDSLRMTSAEFGVTISDDDPLRWCIGPSLWQSFARLLSSDDRALLDAAVLRYRAIYRGGPMFDYDVYDGVVETLRHLAERNITCYVATSKAQIYAREIVASTPMSGHIREVYGCELDGTRVDKKDLIAWVIEQEGLSASRIVMIGDRHHDIDGAHHNGVLSIGVSYGYGSREELAHAGHLIDRPDQILDLFT